MGRFPWLRRLWSWKVWQEFRRIWWAHWYGWHFLLNIELQVFYWWKFNKNRNFFVKFKSFKFSTTFKNSNGQIQKTNPHAESNIFSELHKKVSFRLASHQKMSENRCRKWSRVLSLALIGVSPWKVQITSRPTVRTTRKSRKTMKRTK